MKKETLIFLYTPTSIDNEMLNKPFFETCTLTVNNQPLFVPPKPPQYFASYMPFRHHRFIPVKDQDKSRTYVIALTDPATRRGGLDLLSFHDVSIQFTANSPRNGTITVYCLCENVITIRDGLAAMKFAY